MKAILVISDMPSRCGDCPLLERMYDDEHEEWYELCFWRQCKVEDTERKLSVCPLKPMPEKKPTGNFEQYTKEYADLVNAENRGFNLCVDEILGEQE